MAAFVPLTPSVAHYEFKTDLEDAEYTIKVRYFDRLGTWFLDLSDASGDKILTGAACLLNVHLLKGNTHPNRPAGDLVFVATSQDGQEASFDDFGTRVQLVYLSPDEIAAGFTN